MTCTYDDLYHTFTSYTYATVHLKITSLFAKLIEVQKTDSLLFTFHSIFVLTKYICDPFWENVPKRAKTTTEIRLKVGNNFILQISNLYFLNPLS